jgi:putative spermidine/putrescine transport system substrate-binding protein
LRTERSTFRLASLGAAVALLFAACSAGATTVPSVAPSVAAPSSAPASAASSAPAPSADALAALVTAAKAEGTLNVIALPHDWCNYGALIDGFKAKYGLAVNEINPNGGSGDELQAIVTNKGSTGPSAPDVVDVGIAFGPQAKTAGDIQPYKVSTWDSIDPKSKDADGYWYGDYYGVLSFEVDTKVVTNIPADWADLLKSDYKNEVALAGDPLASNQAIQSVYAAALSNGGSLDNAQPGLDFFKKLNASGNLVHTIAKGAVGETPIVITWSYLALAARDASATAGGDPIQVVIPATGRFGGIYAQAISAYAPHLNAAKLWEEYLYSDAGQNLWLTGYCYTTRYADLKTRSAIDPAIASKLPDVTGAVFPTADQLTAAKTLITGQWKAVVGATIK